MNERPELRTTPVNEWESLERQLRSLTPRDATFQLPSVTANPPHEVHLRDSDSRSRGKRTWVATLIASWSMGAAAGIVGTLLYSRHAADSKEPDVTEASGLVVNRQELGVLNNIEQDDASLANVPGVVRESLSVSNRELEVQESFASTPSWPMPWAFLTRRNGQVSSPQSILTPRNFAIETQTFVSQNSPSVPNATPVDASDSILALPTDQNFETPLNQRDLTRILLEI
jgi:hypothetical protein